DLHGRAWSPHTWSNGYGLVANLHLALAVSTCPYVEVPYDPPGLTAERRDWLLPEPVRIAADGTIAPPAGPRLRVTPDFDAGERRAGGGARGRRRPAAAAGRVGRGRRRLRQQRQHLVPLPHREVHALAELAHERAQHGRRRGEQARLGDARREREQPPAEPVGERVRVAGDEAVLLERLQCARKLALV